MPASWSQPENWTLSSETNPLFTKRPTAKYYRPCRHTLIFLPLLEGCARPKNVFLGLRIEGRPKKHRAFGPVKALGIPVGLNQIPSSRFNSGQPHGKPQTSEPRGENLLGGRGWVAWGFPLKIRRIWGVVTEAPRKGLRPAQACTGFEERYA